MAQSASTRQNLQQGMETTSSEDDAVHNQAPAMDEQPDDDDEEDDDALQDPANDPAVTHLREISSLASWTVSSYKPGCGVSALLNPSRATFWQSDGPQPHLLNIHFFKLVRIVKLRVYLDFELDESYTPTRLSFAAGTHEYDAEPFAEWSWQDAGPKGWVDIDLSQCGSEDDHQELLDALTADDSDTSPEDQEAALASMGLLRCFFLQIRVLENYQNGKDTHIRGVQIFARDERGPNKRRKNDNNTVHATGAARAGPVATAAVWNDRYDSKVETLRQGFESADWMREPELR